MNADTGKIYTIQAEIDAAKARGERLIHIEQQRGDKPPTEADFRAVEAAQAKRDRKAAKRRGPNR